MGLNLLCVHSVQNSNTSLGWCTGKKQRGNEIHATAGKSARNSGYNAGNV